MQPSEVKRELERLAGEAAAARERLAALAAKIATACELVATIRGHESTPAGEPAQEPGAGQVQAG